MSKLVVIAVGLLLVRKLRVSRTTETPARTATLRRAEELSDDVLDRYREVHLQAIDRARKGSAANHEIICRKHRRPGIRTASAAPPWLRLHSAPRSLHLSCFVFQPSGRE